MLLTAVNAVTFLLFRREDVRCLQNVKYPLTVSIVQKSEKLPLLNPLDGHARRSLPAAVADTHLEALSDPLQCPAVDLTFLHHSEHILACATGSSHVIERNLDFDQNSALRP